MLRLVLGLYEISERECVRMCLYVCMYVRVCVRVCEASRACLASISKHTHKRISTLATVQDTHTQ